MSNLLFPVIELTLTLKRPLDYAKGAINLLGYSENCEHYNYIMVNGCELGYKALTETSIKVELTTCELSKLNETIASLFGCDLNEWVVSEGKQKVEEEQLMKPDEEETQSEVEEVPTDNVDTDKPYGLKELKPETTDDHTPPSIGDKDTDGSIYVGKKEYESFTDFLYITRLQNSATGRNDVALPTKYELETILDNVFTIRGIMEPDKKLPVLNHYYWTQNDYLKTKGVAMRINETGDKSNKDFGRSTHLGRLEIKRIRINKQ